MNSRGTLIAIEGIDGSGKSSLAQALYQHLNENSYPVLLTKEPGDTPLGKHIRTIVQEQTVSICPKAEYLLFAADRAQHAQEVIIPHLSQGQIVISDRMGDSSIVYQGYARGIDIDMITAVNAWALNQYLPDVTVFITIDPEIARHRYIARNQKLSAFEREDPQFMHKLHNGFCTLYKNRDNVIIIEGAQDKKSVLQQTYSALIPWLQHYEQTNRASRTIMAR